MAYGKFVHSPSDLPKGEHWAIIEGTSVTIPGDERSRTNPRHGYPESIQQYITYEAFTDRVKFEEELKRRLSLSSYFRNIRGIHVKGSYEATTEIRLSES